MPRLIRHQKLQAQEEQNHAARQNILEALIHKLQNFAIGKERDAQRVEQEFARWKEMNKLNVRKSKKELRPALARVLDGAAIEELVLARQLEDQLIVEKNSRPKQPKARTNKVRTGLQMKATKSTRKVIMTTTKAPQRRTRFQLPVS